MINYNKIHSYHKFIDIMSRLTDEEKLAFLYDYFYKKVDYNYNVWLYAYLSLYMGKATAEYIKCSGVKTKSGKNTYLCTFSDMAPFVSKDKRMYLNENEKSPFLKLMNVRKNYDLNTEKGVEKYKDAFTKEVNDIFFNKLKNQDIKNKLYKIYKEEILDESFKIEETSYEEEETYIFDMPWMITKSYWDNNHDKDNKPVYYNGLIRIGKCSSFADFISKTLNEFDIPCLNVVGRNDTMHEWNIIKINSEIKFIDISEELHIRDQVTFNDYKKGDFYLIDIDRLFELSKDRDIRSVGNTIFETAITRENYKDNLDILYKAFVNEIENTLTLEKGKNKVELKTNFD